jgi:hypothetical protein
VPALLRFDGYSDPSERSIHIVGIRNGKKMTHCAERLRFWGRFTALWLLVVVLALSASFLLLSGIGPVQQSGKPEMVNTLEFVILLVGFLTLIVAGLYGLGAPKRRVLESEMKQVIVQPSRNIRSGNTIKAA